MAKRKSNNAVLEGAKFAGHIVKDYIEHFSKVFVQNIYLAEKKMALAAGSYTMLIISAIIVVISFIFILEEYFKVSKSISFLVLGLIIMIWSLMLRSESQKIKLKEV